MQLFCSRRTFKFSESLSDKEWVTAWGERNITLRLWNEVSACRCSAVTLQNKPDCLTKKQKKVGKTKNPEWAGDTWTPVSLNSIKKSSQDDVSCRQNKTREQGWRGGGGGVDSKQNQIPAPPPRLSTTVSHFHCHDPTVKFIPNPQSVSGWCRPNDTLGILMTPICSRLHAAEWSVPLTHLLFNRLNGANEDW